MGVISVYVAGKMSIPSCGFGHDDYVPGLAESLALLAALGWVQALFKIKEAQLILGTSRAGIYRDLAAGRLEAVKNGAATRITAQSVARRLAVLTIHNNTSEANPGTVGQHKNNRTTIRTRRAVREADIIIPPAR
jgi:hypothetical protein